MIIPEVEKSAIRLMAALKPFSAAELTEIKSQLIDQTNDRAVPFMSAFLDAIIEQKKITAPGGNPETVNGENDSTHVSPTE